jgi:uncharacterized protein (DUF1697 family)
MTDWRVALIRGINVGRAKRVSMMELRQLIEGLGYGHVHTLLGSGNVVFTVSEGVAGDPTPRLEDALSTLLGAPVRVILLSAAELTTVVAENPLGGYATDPSRILLAILKDPTDSVQLTPLLPQDWTPEVLAIGTRAAYLWCPDGIHASRLAQAVGRALGDSFTTRNWATLKKLHDFIEGR